MTSAIVFDQVWKKFRRGERHDSLRDLLPATARRLFQRHSESELEDEEFWALKDVSFQVGPGEALGIIGPNGAGKSTVLKLLTRILKPTLGTCHVTGRVGALIEIAAGLCQSDRMGEHSLAGRDFQDHGDSDVLGVDSAWVDRTALRVNPDVFGEVDFANRSTRRGRLIWRFPGSCLTPAT